MVSRTVGGDKGRTLPHPELQTRSSALWVNSCCTMGLSSLGPLNPEGAASLALEGSGS